MKADRAKPGLPLNLESNFIDYFFRPNTNDLGL